MQYPIRQLRPDAFPQPLREIPDAPTTLYIRGRLPNQTFVPLTVIGSRRHSMYGKRVCEKLIAELRGCPIAIISGLALGLDSIAHEAALSNELPTVAVMPSGLSDTAIYPAAHRTLAQKILDAGGALISEYEEDARPTRWSFSERNRIAAGWSLATLVIEAPEKSGALITARLALEYNREVLAVPHPLGSETGAGTNTLLRRGATLIRHGEDILEALHLTKNETAPLALADLSPDEKIVFDELKEGVERGNLSARTGLPAQRINVAVSMLAIKGIVKEELGKIVRT